MKRLEDPQKDILRASLNILNQYGFGALSMSDVAKYLGVTKQRVYYHYPGNEEILLQLAKDWSQSGQQYTIKALADSRESGCFRILAMVEGLYDWMEADPELARLGLVLYQLSPQIRALGSFMVQAKTVGRERLKSLLLLEPKFAKMKPKALDFLVGSLHSQMYGAFFYSVVMNAGNKLKEDRQNGLFAVRGLLTAALEDL